MSDEESWLSSDSNQYVIADSNDTHSQQDGGKPADGERIQANESQMIDTSGQQAANQANGPSQFSQKNKNAKLNKELMRMQSFGNKDFQSDTEGDQQKPWMA